MYNLLVEIHFFSQLKRVDGEFITRLAEDIDRCTLEANAKPASSGHPFLYQFDTKSNAVRMQAAQAANTIIDLLGKSSKRLHGFRLLLDSSDDLETHITMQKMKSAVSRMGKENGLFLTPAAKRELDEYFYISERGDLSFVEEFRLSNRISNDDTQEFFRLSPVSEAVFSRFDEFAEANRAFFLLEGAIRSGAREMITDCFAKYFGALAPVTVFRGSLSAQNALKPVYAAIFDIERTDCEAASECTKNCFRSLIERIRRRAGARMDLKPQAEAMETALSVLRAGIEMRASHCTAKNIPFLVLLEDAHLLHESSGKIIRDALSGVKFPKGIVVTGNTVPVSSPNGIFSDFDTIPLPPVPLDSFLEYVARTMPSLQLDPEAATEILEAFPDDALARYACLATMRTRGSHVSPDPIKDLLSSFPADLLEMLDIAAFSWNIASDTELDGFLDRSGRKEHVRQTAFTQLYQHGLIKSKERPEPVSEDIRLMVSGILGERERPVGEACARWIYELLRERGTVPSMDMLEYLDGILPLDDMMLLSAAMREFIVSGDRQRLQDSIEHSAYEGRFGMVPDRQPFILHGFETKYQLLYGTPENAAKANRKLTAPGQRDSSPCHALHDLFEAERALSVGDSQTAFKSAKLALMGFQGTRYANYCSESNRILGMASLQLDKLSEAIEYLSNAREIADSKEDAYEILVGLRCEALAHFISGNLSRSVWMAERGLVIARSLDRMDWITWLSFFLGRVLFECGMYSKARERFLSVVGSCEVRGMDGAAERSWTWIGRTFSYEGTSAVARRIFGGFPEDGETRLFAAELDILEGSHPDQTRFAHAEKGWKPPHSTPETFTWDDGYSSIEGLAFKGRKVTGLFALQSAYAAYAKNATDDSGAGLRELTRLNRESDMSEYDPQTVMFHYLQYLSIPAESEYESLDRSTVLSKAFKHLQLRASKIDDTSMKTAYLTGSPWIRTLTENAKKNKLL